MRPYGKNLIFSCYNLLSLLFLHHYPANKQCKKQISLIQGRTEWFSETEWFFQGHIARKRWNKTPAGICRISDFRSTYHTFADWFSDEKQSPFLTMILLRPIITSKWSLTLKSYSLRDRLKIFLVLSWSPSMGLWTFTLWIGRDRHVLGQAQVLAGNHLDFDVLLLSVCPEDYSNGSSHRGHRE